MQYSVTHCAGTAPRGQERARAHMAAGARRDETAPSSSWRGPRCGSCAWPCGSKLQAARGVCRVRRCVPGDGTILTGFGTEGIIFRRGNTKPVPETWGSFLFPLYKNLSRESYLIS